MTTYPQITFTGVERADVVTAMRAPLGPHQVAGPTVVTLVSPGTELSWGYTVPGDFPRAPGYAAVFRVEDIGADVSDLAPGDLAFCLGPHAGWQQVDRGALLPVPAGLAPERAAFARLLNVTMSTLTTTAARPPEPVAVSGLGPVGHLGAQLFHLAGYDVLAVDPLPARRADAKAVGITHVAEALPDDGVFALVVECSGHEQAVLDACHCVRQGGEVVLVGVPWARKTERTAFELLHAVFHRYVHLRSGWEWEVPLHPQPFVHNSLYGQMAGALRWLAEERIVVDGLFTQHAPAEAQEVYQALLHRRAPRLFTLFDWRA
jgi:threonine dehydrogenase-like Zn-dependent dehydrogenase